MNPNDTKTIEKARLQFDVISESARFDIYQKVLSHFKKHPGSPWSGAPLRDLEMVIRQFYSDMGLQYDKVFRDILPPLMQTYYDRAVEEMKTAGVRNAILGTPDSKRIKYFMDSAFEQVAMKTQNMSFQHIKALRSLTADVTRQMSITGGTRREVSKALLEKALEIPGFEFIDKAGTKWPLKSYFSMLARTELMNAARASYDDKVTEEGFDVMKLTTSGHCCEHCARFEGKLFSLTGATAGLPSKQDLLDAGVFHPNCTHSYSLVPDFIRGRDYKADGTKKPIAAAPIPFGKSENPPEPFLAKFDGRYTFKSRVLEKILKHKGASQEQIDEILWNCSPEMQKLIGGVPSASFSKEVSQAGTAPGTKNMQLNSNPNDWNGCRQTISHEFGHVLFNSIFEINKTHDVSLFLKALEEDKKLVSKQKWIDDYFGCHEFDWREKEVKRNLSKLLFQKEKYFELSFEQQWKIMATGDILGVLFKGEYGFGHTSYFDGNRDEAFANIYLARKYGWNEFESKFPNLWKFVGGFIK